ncbi:MAG: condensation domain-containing protein, partial [Chloroflexota bacterium]
MSSGEALSQALVQQFQVSMPQATLINLYGSSEMSADSTYFEVHSTNNNHRALTPIGYPIYNTQTYILDDYLQPVPKGVVGQLYIGGEGLAWGYLNNVGLTAEKFIPHPFSGKVGARLYATGDLGRYLPDGAIEFIGRNDRQVNIRGFRVEIGEVEVALNQHPAIQAAVVTTIDDLQGDKQLIAYFVTKTSDSDPVQLSDNLYDFLEIKLPRYMIPAKFIGLETLPLTPSGKIDRSALPIPELTNLTPKNDYIPPRTSLEETIAQVWRDVLAIDQIGIQDDFFRIGGHSLLATQVVTRLRHRLQIELPVRHLFEQSNIAGLAEVIAKARQASSPPITPFPSTGSAPLSFTQQRLWFLDQLEGPSATYNIPVGLNLKGTLNIDALSQSLDAIVERHTVLRATYQQNDGVAEQVINNNVSVPLALIDLSHLSTKAQADQMKRLAQVEAAQPFDLSQDLMLRGKLFVLDAETYILLITIHHIAADAWSMDILVRELAALYEAYSHNQPSSLRPLAIQYSDFAQWQRQWLQTEVFDQQLMYWKQALADAPPLLSLPTDYPRPQRITFQGETVPFELSAEMTEALKAVSQAAQTTLFMTMLAAFKVLLYRYSNQTDLVVGTPIANRTHPDLEPLIGFFANTLALRTDLSETLTFLDLLAQVKKIAQAAYDHQDLPFERLVESLELDRNLSHTPLFQVMFAWQTTVTPDLNLSDLQVASYPYDTATAKFDLTLTMIESDGQLKGSWQYNSALFKPETIERLASHFQTLLKSLLFEPAQPINWSQLMTLAEKQQLLFDWNNTQIDQRFSWTFHQQFEAQVDQTPERIAVIFEGACLTYEALNQQANQLAHHLQGLGVGPDILVGIYLDRSLAMIVSLLGVLKAGGAYVPIDPDIPSDRLTFILDDIRSPIVITQQSFVETLPTSLTFVTLDSEHESLAEMPVSNPQSNVTPNNLAYAIYTSGSTGEPKGVLIEHRSLLNLASALNQTIYQETEPASLQAAINAPFSVDASVKQLTLLLGGHTLHIIPQDTRLDPDVLVQHLHKNKIDILDCTPTQLEMLLEVGLLDKLDDAPDIVLIAGEAIDQDLWQYLSQIETSKFYNLYGPTECTV